MSDNDFTPYPEAKPNPSFPKMEEAILNFWEEKEIFKKSISNRDGSEEFVFYDGPPFANGLPHYGHLVTSYIKDVVPRYQTMKGKKVERRFGWDCHGLPAELQTEKELEISGRYEILEYGMDKFNDACEKSVLRFTKEWESYVKRMGRWVDFENDYKTLDINYMESVMWLSGVASESRVQNPSFTELPFIYSISLFSYSNQTFGDTITTNTINYYF